MAERRWTVLVVPHGVGHSRTVEFSQTVLKMVLGLGAVLGLAFLVLGVATISRGVNITRSRALERENRLLAAEVQRLHSQLLGLEDTLQLIANREQHVRLLAGLQPTDSAVQLAGIGGPGSPADSLGQAGPVGARARQVAVDVDATIRRANILLQSISEAAESLESHNARLSATPSIMPTRGWLTSAFANERFHPILHLARPHEGIDVTAPMGAPIEAPANGVVVEVRWIEGYGNVVSLDHGYGVVTRYAHCSKILVHRGQRVRRSDKIALVGSTGLSTGPHLHYEVWVNGKPVNPMRYVMPDAIVD
jgi:peptidase M23-like protein